MFKHIERCRKCEHYGVRIIPSMPEHCNMVWKEMSASDVPFTREFIFDSKTFSIPEACPWVLEFVINDTPPCAEILDSKKFAD